MSDGSVETVRTILTDLRHRLVDLGLTSDQCGTVEIVLAEALNNIIEHAYAPGATAPLRLHATLTDSWLKIELRDRGQPLPGLDVPQPKLPDLSGPLGTLPEGGFGWYMIHDLADTLKYHRIATENRLHLGFMINQAGS